MGLGKTAMRLPNVSKMKALLTSTACSFALVSTANSQPARAYVCTFNVTAMATIDPTRGEKPYEVTADGFEVTFAAVDLENHKAQIIGNLGASDIYATRGDGSINLIEQTPSGNIILTTIVDPDKNGTIRAVMSRHIVTSAAGLLMLSQMLGTCTAKG